MYSQGRNNYEKRLLLNFARHFRVEIVIHLFLHNLGGQNSNLPDDILHFVFFTFKLTKTKWPPKFK